MKEHPLTVGNNALIPGIIFGEITLAARPIIPQPPETYNSPVLGIASWGDEKGKFGVELSDAAHASKFYKCPFRAVGDRLWVKEAWGMDPNDFGYLRKDWPQFVIRREDWYSHPGNYNHWYPKFNWGWHPATTMPRWAARIFLEITGIDVIRIQTITNDAAIQCGIHKIYVRPSNVKYQVPGLTGTFADGTQGVREYWNPIDAFHELWDRDNRANYWQKNPWAWLISFKLLEVK